jgi:hypothetical protein
MIFKYISIPLAFYNRDTWLKVAFFAVSVVMAGFSLYFTDGLVNKLEEREKQQIELYAETIRYALTSDNNADINFFFERIKKINENNTIPVIWKDGSGHLNSINIPLPEALSTEKKQEILQQKLKEIIAEQNTPIEMDMGFQKEYIYYGNSKLLKLLRYYPLSQLLVVLIIGFLGYIFLSYSRRAEQNRVWVGLAKETAHQLGMHSNATLLYGHIEKYEHRIDHMERLRQLQDETKGFNTFIPLKFRNKDNDMHDVPESTLANDLKMYAISRLYLDNFPHVKAYWPMLGRETAQLTLSYGVNDIDGTIDDTTKIYSMAGSEEQTPVMTTEQLVGLIKQAKRQPIERGTLYNVIQDYSNYEFAENEM